MHYGPPMTTTLLIRKDRLEDKRLRASADAPLEEGQVRVATDLLALTSNNITYAAFGESMAYWRFFPSKEEGWGVLPVWGFGVVVQSRHPGVAGGERLYGYWPLADAAVLSPQSLSAGRFIDGAPHRAELHPIYNQYLRRGVAGPGAFQAESLEALLRPLFTTSWLIDDLMAGNDFFGARTLLLSSASSKTAYGAAWLLSRRPGVQVVGVTSPRNRAFCERLGCYSRLLTYDQLDQMPADESCVYIDFSGDAPFRQRVHERFGERLRYSCSVGGTHVGQLGGARGLPGPRPTLFFAPAQAKKREEDWGGKALQQRIAADWQVFLQLVQDPANSWLRVREHRGADSMPAAYAEVLGGLADPAEGHVLRLR